jgi:hypothetical protein
MSAVTGHYPIWIRKQQMFVEQETKRKETICNQQYYYNIILQ